MASFAGTIEENKFRRSLKDVFQLMERTHFLLNTVINSCNGTKGVPFTSADVVLQDELDVISDCMSWENETERNIILPYKDVLNIDLLSRVVQNGVTEIPGECNKIFDPLFAFMRDMSKHEKAISSFKGSKEADVMVVLGLHLFSQLIPQSGQSIEMDCMSTKQNKCPCKLEKCDRTVDLTCTAIGSPLTWHGYADIILNKQIPIAFLDKKKKEGDVTENCWEQSKIPEDDSECPGPSSRKRRKESCGDDETTGDKKEVQANLVVEVKKGSQRGSFLVEDKLGQLISQTVTNAFVQVKKSQPDRDLLFPSFGCSSEEIYFFMYDPVNDILLRSSHVISLFLPLSEKFDLRAIIIIWIFLNFTAFVKPDLAKEYQLKESNFHKLTRNCLCYYKEGTFKQRFKSDQTRLDPQSLLKLLIERGELAKKKK